MKKNLLLILLISTRYALSQPVVDIAIGTSTNQFSDSYGPYTNLWYDVNLNSIFFAHRSNVQAGWPTAGFVIYDYSTDGGITWISDQRMAYQDTFNIMRARFPQAVIYNPPGNTVPDSAFVTTFGPANDGTSFGFYFNGTVPLGSAVPVQTSYAHSSIGSTIGIAQSGMIVKNTGTTWWAAHGLSPSDYNDTIHLSKGVFNNATRMFDYSFQKIYVPVCTGTSGSKLFYNQAVAFNDAGDVGYVAVIGNDWVCSSQPLDTTMGVIVYRTTDGGITWNHAADITLSMLDPLLLNNGSKYQSGDRLDIGVDKNNTLHVLITVLPYQPGNAQSSIYPPGSWGLFDIEFNIAADACLIARPETFTGIYGVAGSTTDPEILEENQLQFSRSWDGSKVFFTWFDTDTMIYGPGLNNFPDMHCRGLDVDLASWSNEFNFTEGTGLPADGRCAFASTSYYTINDGANENVPMVYNAQTGNTGNPVTFHYVGGAAVSGYTIPGNCIQLINGIPENDPSNYQLKVSAIYPNPISGKAFIDISNATGGSVIIKITNTLGQEISSATYADLHPGKNTLAIDGSKLSKGLYFCTVQTENESVTKMMSVE